MSHLGDRLEIGHVESRVADGLQIHGLGAVVDEGGDILGLVTLDELGRDAQPREHDLELVVGAAVQVAGGDDVVTGVGEGGNGHELGRLAGRGGHGGHTTLEGSDALFEDVDGGLDTCRQPCVVFVSVSVGYRGMTYIHDPTVDVSKLLEAKQPRSMSRVIEGVGLNLQL